MDLKTEDGYNYIYVALKTVKLNQPINPLGLQNKSLLQWIITIITDKL